MMARTDSERGVWKAPAGTEAMLAGVRTLTVPLTDQETGLLNPLGINVLRTFPITGTVIEESLYRGTRWVVFEPKDERLWGQIRLNVGEPVPGRGAGGEVAYADTQQATGRSGPGQQARQVAVPVGQGSHRLVVDVRP